MVEQQHSIKIEQSTCVGCVACMKACPTKAIRVRDEKAVIIGERCIDCGECFRVCPHGAVTPLTTSASDLKRFKMTIALPSPVLYSQFGRHAMPNEILLALKRIGFDYVFDEAWLCEMVSAAIEEYLESQPGPRPLISSTCPAVVRLIAMKYPNLCRQIIPIDAPREVAAKTHRARKVKERGLSPEEIGVIHITPCPAKMISINRPLGTDRSHLDGAISIRDIYGPLLSALKDLDEDVILQQSSGVGIGWAMTGGEVNGLKMDNCLAVAGVQDVIKILDEVEAGKLKTVDYLECLICPDGCVGGPLTVENRHLAKNKVATLVKMFGEKTRVSREMVRRQYKGRFFSLPKEIAAAPFPPLDRNPARAIEKVREREEVVHKLPGKDCGACGAPDCKTLAEDVVLGHASITDCVFVSLEELTPRD
ncbi:MAG: [Fe-Fe] hydrogenase large subunit C-terminal domain-containing protein [bacterium]